MKLKLFGGVALAALVIPGAAYAQSTGSIESEDVVVTGSRVDNVGGVKVPDAPKAKVVLGEEIIRHQRPGQSVDEIINLVPGVSFTNNDPWGSSGGSFTIRGFDSSRISQTFDGLPLNDSGNYAIYSNQQVDPELLESINVNLGSTDVDSPTASAVGGTVNINTLTPSDTPGMLASFSYGDMLADGSGNRPYLRGFAMVQTGDITGHGTKAWFAASRATNEAAFADYGVIDKAQFNGKLYQELGSNGDFIAVSGHYNVNRNNFGGSPFRAAAAADVDKRDRFYHVFNGAYCTVSEAVAGTVDTPNGCGTDFERRYNPSNTGNVRINSRFGLTDKLTLTLDGGYQYVKANGGGTVNGNEGTFTSGGAAYTGFFNGSPYFGRDLNGDGDLLDRVTVLAPSQTQTHRYTAIVNLAYEINDNHRVRVSYTFDRARHRQTGETNFLDIDGEPNDVFAINDPIVDAGGNVPQKRDRKSFAMLNRIAGEYVGHFLNDGLTVQIGGALPFFQRDLNQYCFTTSSSGFVNCLSGGDATAYQAANPYTVSATGRPSGAAAPVSRTLRYDKFLPNVGFVYHFTPRLSFAMNYAENLSVPSTDTLYNSLYAPLGTSAADPVAETSNSVDGSLRYTSSKVQASVTPWYTRYKNRLVSAYNIDCDCTIDTNLGAVEKYGVDASIAVRPVKPLLLYVFGSYIKSDIKNDLLAGPATGPGAIDCSATSALAMADACFVSGNDVFYRTAGKRERAAPDWLLGGRAQLDLGAFEIGGQIKYTSARYLNDLNTNDQITGTKFKGYTVVDLDLRYSLAGLGMSKSYLQLNLSNLFDEYYIGSFTGGLNTSPTSTSAFVNFGSPRAISGSFVVGF